MRKRHAVSTILILSVLLTLNADFLLITGAKSGGTTERVSIAFDGTEADGTSSGLAISADGQYVPFRSHASNLVPEDTNDYCGDSGTDNCPDVFVYDQQTDRIERISVASDGTEAIKDSWPPAISPDGRYVAFVSWASNLVPDDTNGWSDVFVHDRQTGHTERVSTPLMGLRQMMLVDVTYFRVMGISTGLVVLQPSPPMVGL